MRYLYSTELNCQNTVGNAQNVENAENEVSLSEGHPHEQIKLQAKLLNYFLGSNKSNINQNGRSIILSPEF